MEKLVLVRHGQSMWNLENRFTGWTDVGLSEQGIAEAKQAGMLLRTDGYAFDVAYTSVLKRAEDTLTYILQELGETSLPVYHSWRLNERHYGALQGLNKDAARQKWGDEQVHLWRRSADVRPPALTEDDPRYPGHDPKYKDLTPAELPLTENLEDTVKRVLPYYDSDIKPAIESGKRVLVVAHGNSLRALVMHLENLSPAEIIKVEIPTGKPLVYELDDNINVLRKYYL